MGSFFSYARSEGYPTQFDENKTAVTVDVLEAGFILAFVMLAICFIFLVLGFRGKYRGIVLLRAMISLIIGGVIMVCNFGQAWEVGEIETKTPYKAGSPHEINAAIGVHIGLRSVNVTLIEKGESKENYVRGEKIDYNERFWWTWDQGRFGFGPYAGLLQQSFRQAQNKGLPLPILWIVDYFVIDGEGLRYGRHYRTAGWYTHIAMWTAFPCWLVANILFLSVIRFGAYFTILTGAFQLLACLLWTTIRNPIPLYIHFGEQRIILSYGVNFWLTLSAGVVCIILGLIIMFLDLRYPDELAVCFGKDPLSEYEEYHLTASELEVLHRKRKSLEIDMTSLNAANTAEDRVQEEETQYVLKRRTSGVAQRSLYRGIIKSPYDDEQPEYLNVPRPHRSNPIPEEIVNDSTENLYANNP